jgi:hypothetical protein
LLGEDACYMRAAPFQLPATINSKQGKPARLKQLFFVNGLIKANPVHLWLEPRAANPVLIRVLRDSVHHDPT